MHGHGAYEAYYHSFISYIISFCIASNFHKFDQMNKQKNMAIIDFNFDQVYLRSFSKN
jgi:hypothetical protein